MRATLSFAAASLVLVSACGPSAGGDGGTDFDGGPAGGCETDVDCDDGLYCTGEETCVDARCVQGATIDCADGVACTIDACDDVRRACTHAPVDLDGDGAGDAACLALDGVPLGTDCDDSDPLRFAGNIERCDVAGLDEDCDPSTFGREDLDGDGHLSSRCCNGESCGADCDDTRPDVAPGAAEVCNGFDDDCDGTVDEGVGVMGWPDLDADGRGDAAGAMRLGCPGEARFSELGGDCDDADPTRHPGQAEFCDSLDNDCDDSVDEASAPVTWYEDSDADGYGATSGERRVACAVQVGFSVLSTDCDDGDAAVNPAAAEACNGRDDDCNGAADFAIGDGDYEDDDGDGAVDFACGGPGATDCDDRDPRTSAGASELCDGRDNDCDEAIDEDAAPGVWYRDLDGDSYGSAQSGAMASCAPIAGYVPRAGDCADEDASVSPARREVCNGVDDDCDGRVDFGAACGSGESCVAGRCGLDCDAERADCDGNPANGCEVDLLFDADHCGSCGVSCGAGGVCTARECDEVSQLGLGEAFSCALRQAHVVCWGDNRLAQLGTGSALPPEAPEPQVVPLDFVPVEIAVGGSHVCVLEPSRQEVVCWGANHSGQLGFETGDDPSGPGLVTGLFSQRIDQLVAGGAHNCVTYRDRTDIHCWGRGQQGQLGHGTFTPIGTTTPVLVDPQQFMTSGIARIEAGRDFTCGESDLGQISCWGNNSDGELGQGTAGPNSALPSPIANGAGLSLRAAGGGFACARQGAGSNIWCWGDNEFGQAAGTASTDAIVAPMRVLPMIGADQVFLGASFMVYADAAGFAYALGANARGQLGDGTAVPRAEPQPVIPALSPRLLPRGHSADHVCVGTEGGVYCWGDNRRGQLGTGVTSDFHSSPQRVVGL